jgi:glycosyltransferase involved in cell wall biosynthesis
MRAKARVGGVKILIYVHSFAPNVGGVETYVMLLAQGLAQYSAQDVKGRLQVTVVTPTAAGDMDDATLPFRVVRRPSLMTLARLVRSADVVHVAGPCFLPMLFGLLLRKPLMVEHSGYQAACPNGMLFDERTKTDCPGHFMARRYYECVRCNAASEGWRKSVVKLFLTFPRRWLCARAARNIGPSLHVGRRVALPRTVTIYHGTSQPEADRQRCATEPAWPRCFVYVGRLVREKGVPVLLRAAAQLAERGYEFRLKIIGDGPERAGLEDIAERHGLAERTAFTGYLRGAQREEAIEGAAAVVMPSVWQDVAPLAAIEQMIHGRLLIGSDIGGLGELVDGTGLKFAPNDAAGLEACMQRVLAEPDLIKVLGMKARQRALELFPQERMVAEHLAVYREVSRKSSPSPTQR